MLYANLTSNSEENMFSFMQILRRKLLETTVAKQIKFLNLEFLEPKCVRRNDVSQNASLVPQIWPPILSFQPLRPATRKQHTNMLTLLWAATQKHNTSRSLADRDAQPSKTDFFFFAPLWPTQAGPSNPQRNHDCLIKI